MFTDRRREGAAAKDAPLSRGPHRLQEAAQQDAGDAVHATEITAARELTHHRIRKCMKNEDATMEISMAKRFCGRMARYVADECIQLHGGFGDIRESRAGRVFVDTRLISIGGGADEVMIHSMAKMLGP